ncbi:MAG: 8-oxo-dGTP diphosphatase [Clostridia bacterium]|nr:8-oxo-dGTP diphosphatase [Clostridia bacterium]
MRTEKGTVEFTNMVMVEDKETGRVLVQERRKSWTGLSFPGGHVEQYESIVDSAIREVKEETGLDIQNLHHCGIIHWVHKTRSDRYIVFLYKTNDFSGELLAETDEGRVFWISPDELKYQKLSKNFGNYIPMFFDDNLNEAYGLWHEDEPDTLIYK